MTAFRTRGLLLAGMVLLAYPGARFGLASPAAMAQVATAKPEPVEGASVYANHCAMCHGPNREGNPPMIPSLVGVTRRMKDNEIIDTIHHGRGNMPAFPKIETAELSSLLRFLAAGEMGAAVAGAEVTAPPVHAAATSAALDPGNTLFQQACSFCHGRDAGGGESGPDLTRSQLVNTDVGGDKIMDVVRNGRPPKMPAFNFSNSELASLVSFIHAQNTKARATKGARKGVDVSDLQTGNVEAGKRYFDGAGTCSRCHSATGDLAGIATRYQGLQLEERMLYPRNVKSKVVVTLPTGQKVTGTVAYQDEFTIGLRDSAGSYHSWPTDAVNFVVDDPVEAHVELFKQYTDVDIHNLMAYIQTLR
jgi:mono/diheme cytochrome c family protein